MKKIAIFVEGQAEQIFIRNLLYYAHLVDVSHVGFECIDLRGNLVPFPYPNQNAEVHFQIVNVGNDEKVLSAIKEREDRLFNKGFTKIIGLRDMYSGAYRKRSSGIDDQVTQEFIKRTNDTIAQMNNADNISLHLYYQWFGHFLKPEIPVIQCFRQN